MAAAAALLTVASIPAPALFMRLSWSIVTAVPLTVQLPSQTLFVGALATGGVYVPAAQPPASPFTFTMAAGATSLNCTASLAARPRRGRLRGAPLKLRLDNINAARCVVANRPPPAATLAFSSDHVSGPLCARLRFEPIACDCGHARRHR